MKNKIILIILIVILAAAVGLACFELWSEYKEREKEINDFKELALIAESTEQIGGADSVEEPYMSCYDEKHNIGKLREINNDCIAWITIPDTSISYPVMLTPDNPQKYLRANFYGEYSMSGIPFADANSSPYCTNMIIYGHNMKNETMFSDLTKYVGKDFCDKHPVICLETETEAREYRVFTAALVDKSDKWYDFSNADDERDFSLKVESLLLRALYKTEIMPMYGDRFITLSTCCGSNSSDRIIVVAVDTTMKRGR